MTSAWRRGFVRIVWFLALILAATVPAQAQARPQTALTETLLPAPAPQPGHDTLLRACIALARPGDTVATMIAAPSARYRCGRRALPAPQSVNSYWVRLTPAHPGDSLQLPLLAFKPGWQRTATLSALRTDGSLTTIPLDDHTLKAFTRPGDYVYVPVPAATGAPAAPVVALMLHLSDSVYIPQVGRQMRLVDDIAAARLQTGDTTRYTLFYAVCLTLLVSNLLLWLVVRESFQIAFCLNLLLMIASVWSQFGGIAIPAPDYTIQLRLFHAARALHVCTWLFFWDKVLGPDAIGLRLRRLAIADAVLMQIAVAIAIAMPVAWFRTVGVAFQGLYLLSYPLALLIIVGAVRRRNGAVLILLLSSCAPFIIATFRVTELAMGHPFDGDFATMFARGCEALLSTLALATRVKQIMRERDTARAEEAVARRLADIDPLTGLLNRRALLARLLAQDGAEAQRLLLIDVDHFKAINDSHGHDTGDAVLRELATLLGRRANGRFDVGRLGGEEFAVIGPASALGSGLALGILTDVRSHHFVGRHRLTVSIGTAEGLVTSESTWADLYRRADRALYAAKTSGRNRVADMPGEVEEHTLRRRAVPGLRGT